MSIAIDHANMASAGVQLSQGKESFKHAFAGVGELRESGQIGFMDVPADAALLGQSIEFAGTTRGQYDDVVVLGIGGSALGPIALRTALRAPGWNSLTAAERDGYPRLHVLDNIDPVTIAPLLARLELNRTLFIVTSKSGGTAETMSQYLIVYDLLIKKGLDLKQHIVFVTDPKNGALRQIARKDSIRALDIPPNVGGRFSVLTPVGVLPAALIGIDVSQLLEGALDMCRRCDTPVLEDNPAGTFAVLQWMSHDKHKRNIHVLMSYSDQLRDMTAWFVQLWAESLGKANSGPTPLSAVGATDQHSQVQLFMEGPDDKTITFIAVKERGVDVKIPPAFPGIDELAYLGGHSLGGLLDAELRGTAQALAKQGRPNMTIELERVDPWHVGGFMMLLEIATSYAGQLYGVNAFDQPGVELGKKIAYALLGRPGFNTLDL